MSTTSAPSPSVDELRWPEQVECADAAASDGSSPGRMVSEPEGPQSVRCERRRFPRWLDAMRQVLETTE